MIRNNNNNNAISFTTVTPIFHIQTIYNSSSKLLSSNPHFCPSNYNGYGQIVALEVVVIVVHPQWSQGQEGGVVVVVGGFVWQEHGTGTTDVDTHSGVFGRHSISGHPINPEITVVDAGHGTVVGLVVGGGLNGQGG